jgi:hypothetical protein
MRVTLTAAKHEAGKVEVGPEVSAVCMIEIASSPPRGLGVRKNAIPRQFRSGRLFGDNDLIFVSLGSTPAHNLVGPLRERMNSMQRSSRNAFPFAALQVRQDHLRLMPDDGNLLAVMIFQNVYRSTTTKAL